MRRPFRPFAVVACLSAIGWADSVAQPAPQAALSRSAPVTSSSALPAEDRVQVQVAAEIETVLSSPMAGRVIQIADRIGTRFAKGELLASFDCAESAARAEMAEAEFASASKTLESKLQLRALNGASEIEVALASAAVSRAAAQEKLTKHQTGLCEVHAPFAGSIVRVMGKPFQTVAVGTPLIEIVSAGAPRLRVVAPSRLLASLRPGAALNVSIDETGRTYPATVSRVNARVDPVSQTIEFEARLRQPAPDLLPGMTGTADLQGAAGAR